MKTRMVKNSIVLGIILLFVGAGVASAYNNYKSFTLNRSNIFYVDDDAPPGGDGSELHPFQSIQEAADAAENGDEIRVCHGIYNESVDVTKNLELKGSYEDIFGNDTDGSIINSGSIAIYIHNWDVDKGKISSFTIQNSGFGIFVDYASNIEISDNILKNNYRGIFLFHSHENIVKNNLIYNSEWSAINLEATNHSSITDNFIHHNNYGLIISDTSGKNTISYNCFKENEKGIAVARSSKNEITFNDFINSSYYQAWFYNCRNRWSDNCWDDKKPNLPVYIIWGQLMSLQVGWIRLPFLNVDWRAKSRPNTPYDI